jgi:Fe-S-cluster containining protein
MKTRITTTEVTVGDRDAATTPGTDWRAQWYTEPEPHPNPELGCIRRGLCCKSNPGWFAPGEADRAAELMGMDFGDFARAYLVIDSVEVDGAPVDVFLPVKVGRDGTPNARPLSRIDRLYIQLPNPCVFYTGDGCRIYEARPYECRRYLCTAKASEHPTHEEIGRMWRDDVLPEP